MRKNVHNLLRAAFAVILLIAVPSVGMSQSIWLPSSEGNSVSLEVFKADWAGDNNVTFASSAWFLTGRYQASPSIAIVGELPLSHFDSKSVGAFNPEAENAIGNPYLGILFNPENSGLIGEAGVRVPITSDDKFGANLIGWFSEFDRWEAFIPDLLTVRGRLGGKVISSSGNIHARFLGGGTFWIPTEGGDPELFADVVGQIWFQEDQFMFGATFSGRSLLTVQGPSFTERSEFQFGFGASGTFGNVRPGFHVHIPLGGDGLIGVGEVVDAVFGVNITLLFGQPGGTGSLE